MIQKVLVAAAVTGGLALALPAPSQGARLNGTFVIDAGRQSGGRVVGSHFRMAFPGSSRRFFRNPDSRARDKTFTLIRPGRTGLVAGRFQSDRRFDRRGNSRAGSIMRPVTFAGVRFGLSTFRTDPQSRRRAAAPAFSHRGRALSANLQALTAMWNRTAFNQGAPKPGAGRPLVRGVFNPRTRRFTLQWRSRIRGGAFNGFVGVWRLDGRFVPR